MGYDRSFGFNYLIVNKRHTIITRKTIVTMQLFVPDSDVCAHEAIAQLHATHATLEALNVVEQLQTLDNHGGTATELYGAVRTLLLAADAQH